MTAKVVDFLKESGGSNFTETAPRPPTYGEENELQSNGGNSTKSSHSHKSHVSNKSHASSKSGMSAKGDHLHSPATPRKSNLEGVKVLETMIGHTQANHCEPEDGEVSAPLGFEPEGSTADSPPYSENGTPPHIKWAESLNYLLNDSEGVMLFRDFLEHELVDGSEELQFWFACQGFKKRNLDSANTSDHTTSDIQKAIYKRYVRSEKVKCISKEVRKEIAERISGSIDPCIFDSAQDEVENYMRNETYPAFLRSQAYVQYVQNYMDSPKSSQSSGSNSARPVSQSGLLPVVYEDKELDNKDLSSSALLPVISKATFDVKKTETVDTSCPTESLTRPSLYRSKTPPYPGHISFAPVSAQDSELHSLSSDALTDDTISVTDSSVDGCSHPLIKKPHRKAVMKALTSQNREFRMDPQAQFIPRTEHAPEDRKVAEVDPERFAALVIDKLNRLSEEADLTARNEEKLRSFNSSEASKSECMEKLITSFAKPNTSSFIPLPSATEEENAESILDQHCLRIWKSSAHHTPSHSPPGAHSPPHSKSPDRHKDVRRKTLALSATTAGVYGARGYHKKRDFISYDLDDRNLIVCGTETHRHIHHHHHHHHSSRDSFKKSMAEVEAQTCGISSWRMDPVQNLSTDFCSGEYVNRGRTGTRKIDSTLRECSETSSNIDSGISMMESVKLAPNWNNPTNEKVMKWMMDSETVHHDVTATVQDTDKSSSSHKRSHRPNQSSSSGQGAKSSSKSKTSTRGTSVERGGGVGGSGGVLSAWNGATTILPSQPFAQDPSMPLLTPPNPTTQLEEAKRRLGTQTRTAGVSATPVKLKTLANAPQKDRRLPPAFGPSLPATSHTRTASHLHGVPAQADTPDVSFLSESRVGQRTSSSPQSAGPGDTVIGIYMGQEPIPYRHQLPGRAITLAQIKTLVTKRGPYKYYFKRHSDEFGDSAGAVFEDISDDNVIVPLWQGKIVVKVEKLDL